MRIRFGDMLAGYSKKFPGEDVTALEQIKEWTVSLSAREDSDGQTTVYASFEPPCQCDTTRKEINYGNQDRLEEKANLS